MFYASVKLVNLPGYFTNKIWATSKNVLFGCSVKAKSVECKHCSKKTKTVYETKLRRIKHVHWEDRNVLKDTQPIQYIEIDDENIHYINCEYYEGDHKYPWWNSKFQSGMESDNFSLNRIIELIFNKNEKGMSRLCWAS